MPVWDAETKSDLATAAQEAIAKLKKPDAGAAKFQRLAYKQDVYCGSCPT